MKKIAIALTAALFAMACSQAPQNQQPLENSVVYEMNVRQYTPEGTFAAAQQELPRLQELGIDILWLMPIHPIGVKERKGTLGLTMPTLTIRLSILNSVQWLISRTSLLKHTNLASAGSSTVWLTILLLMQSGLMNALQTGICVILWVIQ